MAIRIALHHKTSYRYDRQVALSPHEVRLRPAPHARTPILSYSLSVLPQAFTTIAPLWPTWHAAQLGLRVIGQPAGGNVPMHVGMLVAVTLVCALLATRRLRRIG